MATDRREAEYGKNRCGNLSGSGLRKGSDYGKRALRPATGRCGGVR